MAFHKPPLVESSKGTVAVIQHTIQRECEAIGHPDPGFTPAVEDTADARLLEPVLLELPLDPILGYVPILRHIGNNGIPGTVSPGQHIGQRLYHPEIAVPQFVHVRYGSDHAVAHVEHLGYMGCREFESLPAQIASDRTCGSIRFQGSHRFLEGFGILDDTESHHTIIFAFRGSVKVPRPADDCINVAVLHRIIFSVRIFCH